MSRVLAWTAIVLGCIYFILPMIGMAEVKGVMPQAHLDRPGHRGHGDYHGDIGSAEVRS